MSLMPLMQVLAGFAVIWIAAHLLGYAAAKCRQPVVLGELLAGVALGALPLLGCHYFEFIKENNVLNVLAEAGVVLLLFEVGLQSSVSELTKVGTSAALVAVTGVVAPMGLGFGVGVWLLPERSAYAQLFLGATLCATSVGITARVLKDLGQLGTRETKIILGAAVIDDVLGLIALAVVQALIAAAGSAGSETVSLAQVAWITAKAALFLIGALIAGSRLAPPVFRLGARLGNRYVLLSLALVWCGLFAYLAQLAGLAPIVGAFAAGLVIDDAAFTGFFGPKVPTLENLLHPVARAIVPVFFVTMGMKVDLLAIADPAVLKIAAVLSIVAVAAKQICGLAATEKGLNRWLVGFGMVPRGEVGLIFAAIGSGLVLNGQRIIDSQLYAAIVIMVMFTTMITPVTLEWALARKRAT